MKFIDGRAVCPLLSPHSRRVLWPADRIDTYGMQQRPGAAARLAPWMMLGVQRLQAFARHMG
ncbi:hypothetical protein, partial [Escherichia coli]|uniref:hypothetical protein n=1 Tax=Escherichia coli TaxID=562 RepID=UPI00195362A4